MIYDSSALFLHSGTGNSLRVAMWMADIAREAGVPATVSASRGAAPEWPADEPPAGSGQLLVGLVLPTHGFTAPSGALRLAGSLPRVAISGERCDAVVVATRGATRVAGIVIPGFEGGAALLCALILRLKGYRIRAAVGVDMPSNWTAIHSGMPADAVTEIRSRGRLQIDSLMATVLSGARVEPSALTALAALALLPVSVSYMLLGRRLLGKLFFASELCTGCGRCAARCSHNAIEMRGPAGGLCPVWTLRCESCMRCMAFCPAQSVEVSHVCAIGTAIIAMMLPTTRWVTG
ncbi:MAG: EFR1 family ferrodoxin [Anaerolineae bacterium]|nr:EFR1 family ferrodoxin [Anaerolineae bacterium]